MCETGYTAQIANTFRTPGELAGASGANTSAIHFAAFC
jgi:hypothetical protein